MANATPDELRVCESDAMAREAARIERDTPKPRKGKRLAFVPTPLSAFSFRASNSWGGDVAVERRLNGIPTGHKLMYRRPAPGLPFMYVFTT